MLLYYVIIAYLMTDDSQMFPFTQQLTVTEVNPLFSS